MLSCISWIRTPTAPGAGEAWLREISGNPGPHLSPWGVFPPFAHCRSPPTRKNCLLCPVQNRSLWSNCMGIFPHETNPTTSRARQGMSERVQARQGDCRAQDPTSGAAACQFVPSGAKGFCVARSSFIFFPIQEMLESKL